MEMYNMSFLVSMMDELLGPSPKQVPKSTPCSSMCSAKQDGFIFSFKCHTNTSNSFKVNAEDTWFLTGKQMIHRIIKEGISDSNCDNGQESKFKGFLAKSIFVTCDRATYAFNIKKREWVKQPKPWCHHLRGDPVHQKMYGVRRNAIYYFEDGKSSPYLNCDKCHKIIKHFDFDKFIEEAFMVDARNDIFRMWTRLPKMPGTKAIKGLTLDQRKREIYIIKKSSRTDVSIVVLSYDGAFLRKLNSVVKPELFLGHFDHIGNTVLVKDRGGNLVHMPGKIKWSVPTRSFLDIDYDDEYLYFLDTYGRAKKSLRGSVDFKHASKLKGCSKWKNLAVV